MAEDIFRIKANILQEDLKALSPEVLMNMLHELHVQHIQLEIMNKELQRIQEELEASRARFADLYDFAPVGYLTLSEGGLILEANLTVASQLGLRRNMLVNQPMSKFILAADQDIYDHYCKVLLETGARQTCELRLLQMDSRPLWVLLKATMSQDGEKGEPAFRVVVTDIHQRKQAEEEMTEYSQRLSLATASGKLGVWDWNVKENVMVWDDRMFELYGITPDTFPNNIDAWTNGLHPDDKQRAIDENNAALAGEKEFNTTFRALHPDGSVKYIKGDGMVIRDPDGKAVRMIGINRDVTESKQTELALNESRAWLEAALASMTDAVFISDNDGNFIMFNDAFASFYRFESKADCLRRLSDYPNILEVFLPDGKPALLERWAVPRALRGETVINAEYILRRKDTGETWVGSYNFSPIRDEWDVIIGSVVVGHDITERIHAKEALGKAQQELEKSRLRYADLYDFAPVAYLTVSGKGEILEANRTAEDMLGMASGGLIGHVFSDFIAPDDQYAFNPHCQRLLETRRKQSYELRLQKKDGPLFHALVETVIDTEGCYPPGQYRVMVSDISVHKEAELANLRHLKERYRAIVMDQNDLICRFDPQGRLTFVNDAYCRSFGVSYQEILGTNFLPDIYEEDLPMVRNHFKNLTQLNPERTIEHRVRLPDGKIYWQQWCGRALYDQNGRVIECQAVGRDITELKQAEEKLRNEAKLRQLFMDALPCVALLLHYHTRRIVASNKAAVAIGAVPGKICYAAWLQREEPCPWCLAPKLWESGQALNDQFRGLDIYWDAYWIPVGKDLYLHYAFDITEEQKIKEALEKAREDLEQRVRERTLELQQSHAQLLHSEKLAAVGNLSASIAHEFNNPLQSVMTIIKGIGRYVPLEKREEQLLALALQECNRMKNLVANLRDFYRPTSGKPGPVDLHATLDGLLLFSKKDLSSRGITVVKKFSGSLPSVIAVNDQLKQVLLNLLTNAADACEGGGVITITTEARGESLVVHVADNGTGISPVAMPHIFEPFFTTKPELKGTGLGLSVSYGIIKKHGGHIEVQSEPGKGATFSVFLPLTSTDNEK